MNKCNKYYKIIIIVVCGICIGFVNGFFGGGGGIICVPILKKILQLNDKESHATTLYIMLPISIASSIIYTYNNFLNFYTLIFLTFGAILGSIIGACFLNKLKAKYIRIIFAILMLISGIKMVV